ncbi:hypothetical protein IWW38_003793, partial [Coemansia aciculifera]
APPPPPPLQPKLSAAVARTQQAEQTGLRRQLSVKKSVSMYKRNIDPPERPPMINELDGFVKAGEGDPILPAVHVSPSSDNANNGSHGEADRDSSDANVPEPKETGEERRTTRKLVEVALRSCHEARIQAASK